MSAYSILLSRSPEPRSQKEAELAYRSCEGLPNGSSNNSSCSRFAKEQRKFSKYKEFQESPLRPRNVCCSLRRLLESSNAVLDMKSSANERSDRGKTRRYIESKRAFHNVQL